MSARKKTQAQFRDEHEAPEIIPAQQAVTYLPLTLSASVAFASQLDAQEQRYSNHRYLHGAVVGGIIGHFIQRGLR